MGYGRYPKRPAVRQPMSLSVRRYDQHIRHAMKCMRVDKSKAISGSTDFSKAVSHEAHIDLHGVNLHGLNRKLTLMPPFRPNLLPRVEQNDERLSHAIEASMSFQNIVGGPRCSTHFKCKLLEDLHHPDGPPAPLIPDSKPLGPDHLNGGLANIENAKALKDNLDSSCHFVPCNPDDGFSIILPSNAMRVDNSILFDVIFGDSTHMPAALSHEGFIWYFISGIWSIILTFHERKFKNINSNQYTCGDPAEASEGKRVSSKFLFKACGAAGC